MFASIMGADIPEKKFSSLCSWAWTPETGRFWSREQFGRKRFFEAMPIREAEAWLSWYVEDVRNAGLRNAPAASEDQQPGNQRNTALQELIFELRRVFWRYCVVKAHDHKRIRGSKLSNIEERERDFVCCAVGMLPRAVSALVHHEGGERDDLNALEKRVAKALSELDAEDLRETYFDRPGAAMPSALRYATMRSGRKTGRIAPLGAMRKITAKSRMKRVRDLYDRKFPDAIARVPASPSWDDLSATIIGDYRRRSEPVQAVVPSLASMEGAGGTRNFVVVLRDTERHILAVYHLNSTADLPAALADEDEPPTPASPNPVPEHEYLIEVERFAIYLVVWKREAPMALDQLDAQCRSCGKAWTAAAYEGGEGAFVLVTCPSCAEAEVVEIAALGR
ncbi:MAG: hypothetical protein IT516_17330 [Burkholderiales bacterium]|nr:hypothetical protein [Burkholderiales bacterium]